MNEHQKRLWKEMMDLVQFYLDGKTENFNALVGKLEGILDAAEIKDNDLINKWYDFWTPLEIRRAIQGNSADKNKALEELGAVKSFLLWVYRNQF
jgi:hypothetical protein